MSKTLKLGDHIPDVTLNDQNADPVSLYEFTGKMALVVFFYPKDDTHGCTLEACRFRDEYEKFEQAGARVIGISSDSVKSHKQFAKKHNLNFTILSDPKREALTAFGVRRNLFGLLPGRATFVFNQDGKLVKEFNSAFQATRHIKEAFQALTQQESPHPALSVKPI